jgi:acetolactate synthase-1/2/3 large subunit
MADRNGGELLVQMLERAGIHQFFTLHGGHLDSIFMAAQECGFCMTDMRHEQAAVQAADGWARTTGKPGVAVVTAGPGVADAVSGVVNAHVDAIPMLVIGGAGPAVEDERLTLAGGFDQVAMMATVTKWAHRIPSIERVPDMVAQALRIATSGRPGPVYLEIPIDVAFALMDEEKVVWRRSCGPGRFNQRHGPRPQTTLCKPLLIGSIQPNVRRFFWVVGRGFPNWTRTC